MLYRYALLNRPAGIGAIPKNLTYTVEPRPDIDADHYRYARHGILVTDQSLSTDECYDFELITIIERHSEAECYLVQFVGDTMVEYRTYYLQMAEDDRNSFDEVVLDKLADIGKFSVSNHFPESVRSRLASV